MSRYSDVERAEILATSRRLLEPKPEPEAEPEPEACVMTFEHRNDRVRREIEERDEQWAREREREECQQKRTEQSNGDAWAAHIEQRIAEAVDAEREFMRGLLAEIVAHMQDEVVDQIERAYAKALSPLKADFEALRYEVKKLTGSSVTELQNPLLRARTQIN